MASKFLLIGLLFFVTSYAALASDADPLQDFCVADNMNPVLVNGLLCKNPMVVNETDFFFRGLNIPGNSTNPVGSNVTLVSAANLPGLNTFGISLARIDFAPGGILPPHYHPRATEILTLLEGTILVGFVTSTPENRQITKVLNKGDVFVFPKALVHYQQNIGYGNAVAISGLSSQNPGVVLIPNTVFGSNPDIPSDVLAKAFQLDKNIVTQLQSVF